VIWCCKFATGPLFAFDVSVLLLPFSPSCFASRDDATPSPRGDGPVSTATRRSELACGTKRGRTRCLCERHAPTRVHYHRSLVSAAAPSPTAPLPTPLHHGLLVEIYQAHRRSASRGGLMICRTRRAAMSMPMGVHRSSSRSSALLVLASCKTCVCYNLLLLHSA
jgi:hypothetical protein